MSANGHADLIFYGGAVYTVDAARSWAQAVAVREGRIVAVGTDAAVRAMARPATETVDLAGGMLVPGFQDAHVHPVGGGLDMLQCDMHDLATKEDYLLAVKTYAEAHPEREWILGGGWAMDVFPGGTPTKELLDAIVPDRCVFLPNRDGHGAWVNSRALEVAGVTRDTPDPDDGRIERAADGQPSGTLHEGAMDLVARHAPPPTAAEMAEGLLRGQEYLHSLGITAWQDAIVDDHDQYGRNYTTYLDAAGRGDLTARVVGALWWDRHRGADQIEELVDLRARGTVGPIRRDEREDHAGRGLRELHRRRARALPRCARGRTTDNRGISFVEPEALKGYVTELDRLGFQVHFHALAERAVREGLDAIEAALRRERRRATTATTWPTCRSCTPMTSRGSGRLGAVANAQPLWAAHESQMDDLTIPFLGEPRWRWQYPFGSLVRAGAMLAMGSDWSVSSPDPLQEMHVAVNRQMPSDYPLQGRTGRGVPARGAARPADLDRRPSRWARPT